jgi:hypothetical protein
MMGRAEAIVITISVTAKTLAILTCYWRNLQPTVSPRRREVLAPPPGGSYFAL